MRRFLKVKLNQVALLTQTDKRSTAGKGGHAPHYRFTYLLYTIYLCVICYLAAVSEFWYKNNNNKERELIYGIVSICLRGSWKLTSLLWLVMVTILILMIMDFVQHKKGHKRLPPAFTYLLIFGFNRSLTYLEKDINIKDKVKNYFGVEGEGTWISERNRQSVSLSDGQLEGWEKHPLGHSWS